MDFSMPPRSVTHPHTRIRQARNKVELSQTALAKSLQVHRSAVSNWESPTGSLPTLENLMRIAHLTIVNFEWLATGRGRMHHVLDESDIPVLQTEYFARDWYEERLLKEYRDLPAPAQKALLNFLEAIKRRK
jgi:transcriptional regulator with XRE-family HTH domain